MTRVTNRSSLLRIGIDCRFPSGKMGGIEQLVLGLLHGLSQLAPGDERYHLLVNEGQTDWLEGRLWPEAQLLFSRDVGGSVRRSVRSLFSDGVIERAGIGVMHLIPQFAFLTRVPSIYHPHDLQHIHLPQNFSLVDRLGRSALYRLFCQRASMVHAANEWTAQDFRQHLGLSADKVRIINLAPVVNSYAVINEASRRALRERLRLPEAFVFYPAQTWPHKNHLGLIAALGWLRREFGCEIPLVCSGAQDRRHQPKIEAAVRAEGLEASTHFIGFVSSAELRALYSMCRLVCLPTTFESANFTMWEAFALGAPVTCSTATSLPAQAGDAAILFDPHDPRAMAATIRRLWEDEAERDRLRERGRERVKQFSWVNSARIFRAHYRRIGGAPVSEEDEALMSSPPLM